MAGEETNEAVDYGAGNIKVLKGLSAVQARPGMYVGDISTFHATHHLLYEIFDNAVDEALAGHADHIRVTVHKDGSASVSDNGRGIPVAIHPEEGISAAEVVFTTLHAGGKFDNDSYAYSGGLHGLGSALVTALSDWVDLEIRRDKSLWKARFEDGATVNHIKKSGQVRDTGTLVHFKPSAKYLKDLEFRSDILRDRFRRIAFLNDGLTVSFVDERETSPLDETYRFDDGISDFVSDLASDNTPITPTARFSGKDNGILVDVALSWMNEDRDETLLAFTNNIPQPDGGQHATGLRGALAKSILAYAEREKLVKKSSRVSSEDLREAMIAVVHVRLPDPAFSSQTKEKLISTEARVAVEAVVGPALNEWLDLHPEEARAIIGRARAASEAREAARRARELSRGAKKTRKVSSVLLPVKLADCSARESERRELFLVEGDSAGGSAKQGRDRETQAILPLRGKILNVERAKQTAVLKNAEIEGMVKTLGAGFGKSLDLSRLRYHKVVVMTDADVDGAHIATLLLTFFFRQMRPLVEAGHLYIATPPLYRIQRRGEEDLYLQNDRELNRHFADRSITQKLVFIEDEPLPAAAAKQVIEPLVDASSDFTSAGIVLGNPVLADILLGQPGLDFLFSEAGRIPAASTRKRVAKEMIAKLDALDPEGHWSIDIEEHSLRATRTEDGVPSPHDLSADTLKMPRISKLRDLCAGLNEAGNLRVAGKSVHGPLGLITALREAGQKGALVGRYKGLGEMNPEELWETTMDPGARTLRQITIADAEAADKTFADLMADNVSARRSLVEALLSHNNAA